MTNYALCVIKFCASSSSTELSSTIPQRCFLQILPRECAPKNRNRYVSFKQTVTTGWLWWSTEAKRRFYRITRAETIREVNYRENHEILIGCLLWTFRCSWHFPTSFFKVSHFCRIFGEKIQIKVVNGVDPSIGSRRNNLWVFQTILFAKKIETSIKGRTTWCTVLKEIPVFNVSTNAPGAALT